jgi:hypothetical protein
MALLAARRRQILHFRDGRTGHRGRLAALPLAWLAGAALQLRERELLPLVLYVA